MRTKISRLTAALSGVSVAQGAAVSYCPSNANGVCFSVAVPTSSASQGSGDIYFQIRAPTSYSWASLGTGSTMANSNLFVMYQDGKGNITLSPRRGTPHTTPSLDTSSTAAQLTLLDGSGVTSDGGTMIANVRCSNCESWSAGSMSLSSTSASWVGGWKSGSSLGTTNRNARIAQHDDTTTFQLDLTQAVVSSDGNPFTDSGSGSGSSNPNTGGGNTNTSGGNTNTGGGNTSTGGVTVIAANTISRSILAAHGVVMGLVFAALYPLGSLLMPLVGKWWLHAVWQSVAFILMWIGFGTGVRAANERSLLFNNAHTVFGTVVVCLLAIQPALGMIHHRHFVATGGRGAVSYAHVWYGRILLALGVINGGVGLNMVQERDGLVIAYAVVAAICFLGWFAAKGVRLLTNKKGDNSHHKEVGTPLHDRYVEPPRRPYEESRDNRATRYQ